jgi:glycosyltransferase involved in cell wall biosynthesis
MATGSEARQRWRDPPSGTLVVLPTFNELDALPGVLEQILAALPTASILVVDDGSPDGTGAWAQELARREPRLDVLQRRTKLGLGSAYKAGFAWGLASGFTVLVEMDADGSHTPDALPGLLAALQAGADLALGSRYVAGGSTPGWPSHRRALSRTSNAVARGLLDLPVADATSGFRAYRADVLRAIDVASVTSDGYAFQVETLWRVVRSGGRVVEVPITFHDRVLGVSKINRREVALAAWTLLRLRRQGWRPAATAVAHAEART